MSRSQAQKLRQRSLREGKLDPTMNRLHWFGTNPVTKTTPTRIELQARQQNKHKSRNLNHSYGDDSFYFSISS
ncbi:hypothetical protein J2736_000559 [Paenibacillus qinlingensis]|uniref:Uncharacterized protein n=1 Tax=Paenibacillus qinlingensis TaxID=1837343 RepID=A0ABU1NPG8_9BACL|nr:hypothetical protein [Paenibacillus qinlingensis]